MKSTRKLIITVVMAVLLSTSLFGQSNRESGERPQNMMQERGPRIPDDQQIEKMISELTEELSLDSDQAEKVEALYREHFAEMESVMKEGKPDRSTMDALKKDVEDKVKKLLSKKQTRKFEKYIEKSHPQGGQRPEHGPRR